MSIHASDPFATPEHLRSPARRLRGRLPTAVTLWTARHPEAGPAGLTVSSTLVVDGEPARLFGVIDPESELWAAVEVGRSFSVVPLTEADRQLADRFAGLLPAPGGLFRDVEAWTDIATGPVPAHLETWAECQLAGFRPVGWGLLVEAVVVATRLAEPVAGPLVHHRGRYRTLC